MDYRDKELVHNIKYRFNSQLKYLFKKFSTALIFNKMILCIAVLLAAIDDTTRIQMTADRTIHGVP